MKHLKTVVAVLVALLVGYTFYLLWELSQPKPVVYGISTPEVRDIELVTVASGTLETRSQVELKPQVTGIVQELRVSAGKTVHVGDIVAVIRIIPDMSQLNSAQSQVESARIDLSQAERDAARSRRLYDDGVVSQEENEQQQHKLAMAREALKAAQYQVDVLRKGFSARSAAENTTTVRSSMTGTVLDVPVKVGTSVSGSSQFSSGTTIAKVGNMRDIVFNGSIDEADVAKLRVGMQATVVPGAMPDVKIPATLEYISPEGTIENGAKVFEVRAAAHIPDSVEVRSGYSVNAFFVTNKVSGVMAIDESCIVFEDQKPYVYRLTTNPADSLHQQFERLPVEIGLSDGLHVEVKKGVDKNMILRTTKK